MGAVGAGYWTGHLSIPREVLGATLYSSWRWSRIVGIKQPESNCDIKGQNLQNQKIPLRFHDLKGLDCRSVFIYLSNTKIGRHEGIDADAAWNRMEKDNHIFTTRDRQGQYIIKYWLDEWFVAMVTGQIQRDCNRFTAAVERSPKFSYLKISQEVFCQMFLNLVATLAQFSWLSQTADKTTLATMNPPTIQPWSYPVL